MVSRGLRTSRRAHWPVCATRAHPRTSATTCPGSRPGPAAAWSSTPPVYRHPPQVALSQPSPGSCSNHEVADGQVGAGSTQLRRPARQPQPPRPPRPRRSRQHRRRRDLMPRSNLHRGARRARPPQRAPDRWPGVVRRLRFNSSSSPSSLPSLPVSRHRRLRCDAALRQIVAMVSQIGGPEALEDLAVELASKSLSWWSRSRPLRACPPPMSLTSCSSTDTAARVLPRHPRGACAEAPRGVSGADEDASGQVRLCSRVVGRRGTAAGHSTGA
jgi:hypothetical protein